MLVRFLAVALGVAAGSVAAELLARRILGAHYALRAVDSENFFFGRGGGSYTGAVGRHSFDAEGFRRTGPDTPHDYEVLFVGDSFTEGDGVDDEFSFPAAAERSLAQRGIRARSLNAGMVGLGTAQELRLLRRILDRQRVDAVVLAVFPWNDLDDNREDGGFGVENGRLVEYDPPRLPPLARLLTGNGWGRSVLVRMLVTALRPRLDALQVDTALELERLLLLEVSAVVQRHHVPLVMAVVGTAATCRGQIKDAAFLRVRDLVRTLDPQSLDLCRQTTHEDDFGTVNKHYSVAGNVRVGAALADVLAPLLTRSIAPPSG